MALSNLAALQNALSQVFSPELQRQANRVAVTGSLIQSEKGFGKNVAFDVQMNGATASSYAEGADVQSSEFAVDADVPATLSWGHYRSAFQLSETQLDAAASSMGSPEALMALLGERIMNAGQVVASAMNVDMLSGTGTDGSSNPNIVGLLGGALAASGTYAGINRSTYPLWAGNALANGGVVRPLTMDLLEQADQLIFNGTSLKASALVMDSGSWRKYKGLFEPLRRIEGEGPVSRYDSSTSNLFWNGVPVFRDKDMPAGTIIMGDWSKVKKVYLPSSDQSNQPDVEVMFKDLQGSNGDEVISDMALPVKIQFLAKTGDSLKVMVKVVAQLKVLRPKAFCVISDISV